MTLRNATKDFRVRVRTVGLRASALYAIPCIRPGGGGGGDEEEDGEEGEAEVRVQTPKRRKITQKVLYEKDAQKP